MATRRHNGSSFADASTAVLSPAKEEIRRRLFLDTPQKPFRSRAKTWTMNLSRNTFVFFVAVGIILIVGVHVVLLKTLLTSEPSETIILSKNTSSLRNNRPTPPLAKRELQSLQENDWNMYTIRINTWQRPEQLLVSVDWHAKCPGVAQIQVVWCDPINDPPLELNQYDKVVIERHSENSLNERFNILLDPPTLGILSIDDDVLRPCEAIDSGFFKWTQAPDRMVGFDGRLHVESDDGMWKYGYMSTTEKANQYSMSLTRFCFLHKDYLKIYMNELPLSMLRTISKNKNCEDIAMTLLVSSLTNGRPPLLADSWAIKSMVKLFVEKKISGGHDHKRHRDECVNSFAKTLGLKEVGSSNRLQSATLYHTKESFFDCGDSIQEIVARSPMSERQVKLQQMLEEWHAKGRYFMQTEVNRLMSVTAYEAYKLGLISQSDPWKKRFNAVTQK